MLIHLQLRNATEETLSPEAINFADHAAVEAAMLASARSMIGHDAMDGHIDLTFRLDAGDQSGTVIRSLRFEDAIRMTRSVS